MLVVKDSEYKREVKSSTGFFSWSSKDQGSLDETVQHTEIFADKGLTLTTAEGVVVEYKETGNLQQDIAQLAQAPGLEWMAEVANRDDVNWQAVQEVHDQWSKSDSGIGGPGMQLVSLAMAVALSFTPGGQGFAGAPMTTSGGQATAFGAWATSLGIKEGLSAAIAAGFNALVMQAGMQIVGNGGDIGAALKALASIDTVRLLATAMLTAGLGHEALSRFGNTELAQSIDGLAHDLATGTIQAGINTGVGTAINGGNLGDNLIANLHSTAVSVLGANMAQEIGAAYKGGTGDMDYVAHKIAHAALGGAMDVAMGGDGVSGAIGGVVGEITAEALADELLQKYDAGELSYDDLVEWQDKGVNISRLVAGLAATVVGGDVDAAAEAGGNAAENNGFWTMLVVAYAKLVGKGDPVKGAAIIGNGDDPLSVAMGEALATGVAKGVELGYENYPEATEKAVQALVWLDGTVDATVTYLDEATGQYVSKAWNSLDYDTQGLLLVGGKSLGLTLSFSGGAVAVLAKAKKVASVAKAVDAVLPDSLKNAKIVKALAESDVWKKNPIERGNTIEEFLAATEYKDWFNVGQLNNGKFDLVDFQKGKNLISLKTVDTTGNTWLGRMQEHIVDLGSRGATVEGETANMILDLRVQPGGSKAAQSLIDFGQKRGVTVVVKEF